MTRSTGARRGTRVWIGKDGLHNLLLLVASSVLSLALAECGLRWFRAAPPERQASQVPLHVPCGDCGWVYELNPSHPGISPQKLRDRTFAIPKPAGTERVLILGDSVTYGVGVPREQTFAKRLERALQDRGRRVEVVNAGVSGYTTFNELRWFQARGASFEPDWVILAFCMNDVVDPLLHWHSETRMRLPIPPEAVPDPAYHDGHVHRLDLLHRGVARLSRASRVLDLVLRAAVPAWDRSVGVTARQFETSGGRRWPVYLSTEDSLSIEVLTDASSPQWRWLDSRIQELRRSVESTGARFAVLILPLAYQLEADYPYRPGKVWQDYCRREGLVCWDVLDALQPHPAEAVFLSDHWRGRSRGGRWDPEIHRDVWHLTAQGHQVVADALAEALPED